MDINKPHFLRLKFHKNVQQSTLMQCILTDNNFDLHSPLKWYLDTVVLTIYRYHSYDLMYVIKKSYVLQLRKNGSGHTISLLTFYILPLSDGKWHRYFATSRMKLWNKCLDKVNSKFFTTIPSHLKGNRYSTSAVSPGC